MLAQVQAVNSRLRYGEDFLDVCDRTTGSRTPLWMESPDRHSSSVRISIESVNSRLRYGEDFLDVCYRRPDSRIPLWIESPDRHSFLVRICRWPLLALEPYAGACVHFG